MSLFNRHSLGLRYLVVLLGLVGLSACSNGGSGGFGNNGGSGNKGGNASTNGGAGNSQTGVPNAGSNGIDTPSDAGVIIPDSTVEDPDTYVSSCEEEGCTADEACFESCPNGSCCVHACPGQVGAAGSAIPCCDQGGGVVPGASCGES